MSLSATAVEVWVALAFVLWLALTVVLQRLRLTGATMVAAALSWLVAGLLLWWAPTVVHWVGGWLALAG